MITKAEILQIDYSGNTCTIRMPLFESAAGGDTAIAPATFSTIPGIYNNYKEGDIVLVAFENGQLQTPIVIGKLYLGAAEEGKEARGAINCETLVSNTENSLPLSTKIVADKQDVVEVQGATTTYKTLKDVIDAIKINSNEDLKDSCAAIITEVTDARGSSSTLKQELNRIEAAIVEAGGNKTYQQGIVPTDAKVGDLWFCTANIENYTYEKDTWYRCQEDKTWAKLKDGDIANISTKTAQLEVAVSSISASVSEHTTSISNLETTTTELDAKIDITASNILTEVASTYTTKKNLEDNYSTTVQMNSAISQSASEILTTVASTYTTIEATGSIQANLQSQITQQASEISAKVNISGGGSAKGFGWSLTTDGFKLKSNVTETEGEQQVTTYKDVFTVNTTGETYIGGDVYIAGVVKDKDAIKETKVEYALSNSQIAAPTSGWSTTAPQWQADKFMWQRTTNIYNDSHSVISATTCIQGAKGEQGEQGPQGEKGTDGTSVTIKGTVANYTALLAITGMKAGDGYIVDDASDDPTLTPEQQKLGVLYTYSTNNTWAYCGQIKGPAGNSPYIGTNGNWWIGLTDTGIKAQGEAGQTPYIGANGNWWIGTTDTRVKAEGKDGQDGADGKDGEDAAKIISVTPWYALATTAPVKPTEKTPTSIWFIEPPAYEEGKKYYITEETIYSKNNPDTDFSWSEVVEHKGLNGSYTLAQGKSTTTYSAAVPTNTKVGDAWFNNTNNILYQYTGESKQGQTYDKWEPISDEIITNKVTTTYVEALDITAKKIDVVVSDTEHLFTADATAATPYVNIANFSIKNGAIESGGDIGNDYVHIGADRIRLGKSAVDGALFDATVGSESSVKINNLKLCANNKCWVNFSDVAGFEVWYYNAGGDDEKIGSISNTMLSYVPIMFFTNKHSTDGSNPYCFNFITTVNGSSSFTFPVNNGFDREPYFIQASMQTSDSSGVIYGGVPYYIYQDTSYNNKYRIKFFNKSSSQCKIHVLIGYDRDDLN